MRSGGHRSGCRPLRAELKPDRIKYIGQHADHGVSAEVLAADLTEVADLRKVEERFASRGVADFQDKLLSAMRFQFGGHLENSAK